MSDIYSILHVFASCLHMSTPVYICIYNIFVYAYAYTYMYSVYIHTYIHMPCYSQYHVSMDTRKTHLAEVMVT